MKVNGLIPVLNVSNLEQSFAWFEKLGWKKHWEWGDPPDFGSVHCGNYDIFLCQDGQGGRGKGPQQLTFHPDEEYSEVRGNWVWISVDDVDEVHRRCIDHGIVVTFGPADMPWHAREMHISHPDGHIFRIGADISE